MLRLGPHNHSIWRLYRFLDPVLALQYERLVAGWCLNPLRIYCCICVLFSIEAIVTWVPILCTQPQYQDNERCHLFDSTPMVAFFSAVLVTSTLLLLCTFFATPVRRYPREFHMAFCCTVAIGFSFLMRPIAISWVEQNPIILALETPDIPASLRPFTEDGVDLLKEMYANRAVDHVFLYSVAHWMTIGMTGLSYVSIFTNLVIFTSYLTAAFFVPHLATGDLWTAAFATSMLTIFILFLSLLLERARIMSFLSSVQLSRELQSSQLADSILNHTLKNTLADVAGYIEMFLANEASTQVLEDCILCLRRGMKSCKERQMYLKLVGGKYCPLPNLVDLREFGQQLAAGRGMQGAFFNASVYLDGTLCGLILDNAITNAFRHGRPQDPCVSMRTAWVAAEGLPADQRRLRFEIQNIADPARPPLTRDVVRRLFAGEGHVRPNAIVPVLSDHIGLSHCLLAAKAGGFQLDLKQEGDVVTFSAELNVRVVDGAAAAATDAAAPPAAAFPGGLRFLCLDDSAAARKWLKFHIRRGCNPSQVRVFGECERDIDDFMAAASTGADIVILDQNLEYSQPRYGTHIARLLRAMGFAGLICIRSGNDAPEDRQLYFDSGANCVLGKDQLGSNMVEDIRTAFLALHMEDTATEEDAEELRPDSARLHSVMGSPSSGRYFAG